MLTNRVEPTYEGRSKREICVKILLADDHGLLRQSLAAFLRHNGPELEVLEAADFGEVLELAEGGEIDLFVLDYIMPGMDGLAGLDRIRARHPDIPVVIMSGIASKKQAMKALEHGAAGFIPKTMRSEAMLNALRLIMSGERYIPEFLLQLSNIAGVGEGAAGAGASSDRATTKVLTKRESEVMTQLVKGGSNKTIARRLGISVVTVKIHLHNVYRKFGVSNRTQAVALALQNELRAPA